MTETEASLSLRAGRLHGGGEITHGKAGVGMLQFSPWG